MADIELTIPQLSRVVDGICGQFDYDENKIGPETRGEFSKRMLGAKFIIPILKEWENTEAYKTNKAANDSDIDTNIVIT